MYKYNTRRKCDFHVPICKEECDEHGNQVVQQNAN